jgi:hypothetical protein
MAGNRLMRRVRALSMSLFRTLRNIWGGSTRQLPAGVQPDEVLTSYVFRENQIVRITNTIHSTRLIPRRNPESKRLEVSVCRSSELTEVQIWNICSTYFDPFAPKPAIGRGVGPAAAVFAENLAFDADGKPYPEHANIIGWFDATDKPDNELKHYWMDQAQRIAKQFSYMPRR